jgi:hypothetical protein
MNFDELRAILERIKDESLVPINDSEPLLKLVNINNEGVNHGVMQMYYKLMAEIYKAETKTIREKIREEFAV